MAKVTMQAPQNPYRLQEVAVDGWTPLAGAEMAAMPPATPRHDTTRGPGLTALDLDRIARDHFQLGVVTESRARQEEIDALEGRLADVYDEGYTEGRAERARGLAVDFHRRAMELHFRLQQAERGSKSRAHERLAEVRAGVDALMEFADAMASRTEKAAAQVARDDG